MLLSTNPYLGMVLSVGIAVASMALGILASDIFASVPPSFSILAVAIACSLVAYGATSRRVSRVHR